MLSVYCTACAYILWLTRLNTIILHVNDRSQFTDDLDALIHDFVPGIVLQLLSDSAVYVSTFLWAFGGKSSELWKGGYFDVDLGFWKTIYKAVELIYALIAGGEGLETDISVMPCCMSTSVTYKGINGIIDAIGNVKRAHGGSTCNDQAQKEVQTEPTVASNGSIQDSVESVNTDKQQKMSHVNYLW